MVALGTCDALPPSSRRLEFPSDEREEEEEDIYLLMKLHVNLDQGKPRLSHCFMLSEHVTRCPILACKGKATAWEVWRAYPQVTGEFLSLATGPGSLPDNCFATLHRFVVLLFDQTMYKSNQQREFSKTVFVHHQGSHHTEYPKHKSCCTPACLADYPPR